MAPPVAFRSIEAAGLPLLQAYRLLTHFVAPRPIALVSTQSPEGAPNLAPFSFFMAGGANPPSVVISPVTDGERGEKDTLRNIRGSGEFTINLVTEALVAGSNQASAAYPRDVSEWTDAGLTPAPGLRVACARVAESLMAIECRLFQVVPHGQGPLAANYVIGEVLVFHVAEPLFDEQGRVDPGRIDYVMRMGDDWYQRALPEGRFELPRP